MARDLLRLSEEEEEEEKEEKEDVRVKSTSRDPGCSAGGYALRLR